METTKLIKIESDAYESTLNANTDEEQFYSLCDYFKILKRDSELNLLTEDIFEENRRLYLQAGEALFVLLSDRKVKKLDLWSAVVQSMIGAGNRDMIMLSQPGASKLVTGCVHEMILDNLRRREVSERVELVLDEERGAVYLKSDPSRYYEIKSRGDDSDKKRFKIILALYQTSKWMSIKTLANKTGASDEPTALKQISGINNQFQKEIGLTHPLIIRQKKDNKYLYQLNHERYYSDLKPAGS